MTSFVKSFFWRPAAWAMLVLAISGAGCKKAGAGDPGVQPARTDFSPTDAEERQTAAPGFGNSTALPTGLPFALPTGLQFSGDLVGTDGNPPDSSIRVGGNDLQYVTLRFGLTNTTSQPTRLILPSGLVFVSSDNTRQNGLLVQTDTLHLKPGTTIIQAGLYCLNDNRLAASGSTTYQIGAVTQFPAMVDLLRLLSTKSVAHWSTLSVAQIAEYSFPIQDAVWQIAHTGNLPAGLRSQLEQLP